MHKDQAPVMKNSFKPVADFHKTQRTVTCGICRLCKHSPDACTSLALRTAAAVPDLARGLTSLCNEKPPSVTGRGPQAFEELREVSGTGLARGLCCLGVPARSILCHERHKTVVKGPPTCLVRGPIPASASAASRKRAPRSGECVRGSRCTAPTDPPASRWHRPAAFGSGYRVHGH